MIRVAPQNTAPAGFSPLHLTCAELFCVVEVFLAPSGGCFAPYAALGQCRATPPIGAAHLEVPEQNSLLEGVFCTLNGHGNQDTWEAWQHRSLSVGDIVRISERAPSGGWRRISTWRCVEVGWEMLGVLEHVAPS